MNAKINISRCAKQGVLAMLLGFFGLSLFAQELEMSPTEKAPRKLAKNTFESVWIIDNQTVMVPIRGTLEFDILHRFGKVNNDGDFDLFGLFAPSNIRMGLSYTPINNLQVGVGLTKDRTILDGSLKYAILKQTADSWAMPVSLTYYGNMGVDLKEDPDNSLYQHNSDRFRYFHQLIIARKITSKLSLQVAPSISWQNFVYGYFKTVEVDSVTTRKEVAEEMEHAHFALAFSGRYKLTESIALMVNYDQPITKHTTNNPFPNLSFGFEFSTSGHAFQIFAGNYSFLNPQRNNLFNQNSPFTKYANNDQSFDGGNFLIGFNITRLWN